MSSVMIQVSGYFSSTSASDVDEAVKAAIELRWAGM